MRLLTLIATPSLLLLLAPRGAAQDARTPAEVPVEVPAGAEVAPPLTSSGLGDFEPTAVQCSNLWKLGKVWGFLKYHHPLVTLGDVDWDQELFAMLPSVIAAETEEQGLEAIGLWVGSFPAPTPHKKPRELRGRHLQPDLDWIHDEAAFGEPLCAYLESVYLGRHPKGPQKYVKRGPGVGNPNFDDEDPYADLPEIDAGFRLLALFRFWNIIEWWSPYLDLLDDDWEQVLADFIPRMLACETRTDYGLELVALSALVKDTHTNVWDMLGSVPPAGPLGLPVALRFVEGKAMVWREHGEPGKPEVPGALRRGDVLLSIDGRPVGELAKELAPLYAASNQPTRLRNIAWHLPRGIESEVAVRIERDGEELEFIARRTPRVWDSIKSGRSRDLPGPPFRLLDEDIAYIKLSTAKAKDVAGYLEQAAGTRGLVIDIRNYPSDFPILFTLGGRLVPKITPFARFTVPDLRNPGANIWGATAKLTPIAPHYGGKVVVLVDESTQSRGEYMSMGFRAVPGALVVGSTTAGADGNASYFTLPGNLRSMISGIGVFYPDRTPTQRIGIVADVELSPTISGMREGRDESVEEAVRQILGADADEERVRRIAK